MEILLLSSLFQMCIVCSLLVGLSTSPTFYVWEKGKPELSFLHLYTLWKIRTSGSIDFCWQASTCGDTANNSQQASCVLLTLICDRYKQAAYESLMRSSSVCLPFAVAQVGRSTRGQ